MSQLKPKWLGLPIDVHFVHPPLPIQRARITKYVNTLIPRHIRTPNLVMALEKKGVTLINPKKGRYKGYYSSRGIVLFEAKTLGWKNFRADGAGKRGFFRADAVFIHELMHAVWHLGEISPGFKQAVYALHAEAVHKGTKFFHYHEAEEYPEEWFCDQFPRALLFRSTCYPPLVRLLKKHYFKGPLPNIKMLKGEK